ncbi:MAG: hypothetical protein HKN46_04000 [Acidimicrobiia bacterium]|nr:hypothetical protein [Acidimicrobiia bacterium]
MDLTPGTRRLIAITAAINAVVGQVLLAPLLAAGSILLVLIAVLAGPIAVVGVISRRRRLTEYPLVFAALGGLGLLVSAGIIAVADPTYWLVVAGQLAVLILWGAAWGMRVADFEEDESAWNRSFLTGEHRRASSWVERRQEKGPRWEALERARMEKADPFTSEEDTP